MHMSVGLYSTWRDRWSVTTGSGQVDPEFTCCSCCQQHRPDSLRVLRAELSGVSGDGKPEVLVRVPVFVESADVEESTDVLQS